MISNEDIPKKQVSSGKENNKLIHTAKERATCLSKRKRTLFKKSLMLHKKTGVDIFLVVKTKNERRFIGTGKLRNEFLSGKLQQGKGYKEVTEKSLYKANVMPLADTPSPQYANNINGTPPSRIADLLRLSTKRCLGSDINNAASSSMPQAVLDVIRNKPAHVLLENEIIKVSNGQ